MIYTRVHMAAGEIVDIVDEHNNVTGYSDVQTAHEQRLMHRVVGIFVFDTDGDLYLQTGNKYEKLDLAVGGHVKQGESYDDAAVREMSEEIGLSAPVTHITTFLPENAKLNHFWAVYTATAPEGWEFQETEEVKSLEKMSMEDITNLMESNPDRFTRGFLNTMREFLKVTKKRQ
jgi:ADP-ribose pyrophosphatase YjhB (NUDIX family)